MTLLFVGLACSDGENGVPEDDDPEDPITTTFEHEIHPALSMDCFAGAYYRKAVTSKDFWLGIGGTVVLPEIVFDEDRKNPKKEKQYLDNPSVYMGGSMGGQETDIGLTWEVIRDENGEVSQERLAFRPFMRRTAYGNQASNYSNAPAEAKYYWYPGDEVSMSVQVVEDGKLKFIVEGEGKRYETNYDCAGYIKGNVGEFKRVNAIDQVSNEGKPAQATKTKVLNAKWKETYLFREYNGEVVKAPMHYNRFCDMRCPDAMYFDITTTAAEKAVGAETININGEGY